MSWIYNTGVCSGTSDMLDQLADWISNATNFPTNAFTKQAVGGAGVYLRTETANLPNNNPSVTFSGQTRCWSRGGVRWWIHHNEANGIFGILSVGTETITATLPAFDASTGGVAANKLTPASGGNHSRASRCYPVSGANKFWFFASDDREEVHVRFQRSNGAWQGFSFGKIRKPYPSAWVGGEFFAGQCAAAPSGVSYARWTDPFEEGNQGLFGSGNVVTPASTNVEYYSFGVLRVEYSGQKWGMMSCDPGQSLPEATYFHSKICIWGGERHSDFWGSEAGALYTQSPNNFNGRSVGVPIGLFIHDIDSTDLLHYLGDLQGIRWCGLGTAVAEQVVNDDWIIFPKTSAAGGDPTPSTGYVASGNLAVAYYCPEI